MIIFILLTGASLSYGSAPLLRLLRLDIERITVPFSSKGIEPHGEHSPCGRMVCAIVCPTVYPIVFRHHRFNYRPKFQDQ